VFSAQIFQENIFLKTKPNFPLTGKCFPLTNFSNGKQTQKSLENGFPETTFRKTNTTKMENTFLETKPNFSLTVFPLTGKCFSLTGKCFLLTENCFPLTNFLNGKQTQESLESGFLESEFRETNMVLTRKYFLLIGKCFSLTNFSNDKQTQESLKTNFSKNTFQKTNNSLLVVCSVMG